MPSLWAPYKEIQCYISSSYGRLSGILNNFYHGKTVTFGGLIRVVCYGIGTESLRSESNRSVEERFFHGFNRTVIIRTERSGIFL